MIPPKQNAAFVAQMEDVLDLYAEPRDPARPVVCVDEAGKRPIGDVRPPLPVRPGSPAKEDSRYARGGTANPFMAFGPPAGRRFVEAAERKTAVDFARFLKRLCDGQYPDAERIRLVCDNLGTHTPACPYRAFAPAEAHRPARRVEWRFTPEHGSRLNTAETELSVPARQCPDRRIPGATALAREVAAWQRDRNAAQVGVRWQFTTADARIKLRSLYPTIELQ